MSVFKMELSKEAQEVKKRVKKADKVAIVGWAMPTRTKAPYSNEAFDIWSCNELNMEDKTNRFTAFFNLHTLEELHSLQDWGRRSAHLLKETLPVFTLEDYKSPEIPSGVPYPFEDVFKSFGNEKYFTSSIAQQIALAIVYGYKEIHIYGVEMLLDSEYRNQRACCEYYIGIARGMGIITYLPKECTILKSAWVYGLETEPQDDGLINQRMVADVYNRLIGEHGKATAMQQQIQGAIQQVQQFIEIARMKGRARGMSVQEDQKVDLDWDTFQQFQMWKQQMAQQGMLPQELQQPATPQPVRRPPGARTEFSA